MDKKVIAFVGFHDVVSVIMSGAKRYMLNQHVKFATQTLGDHIGPTACRLFGLMFDDEIYKDRQDEKLPDFFGASLKDIKTELSSLLWKHGGAAGFMRVTCRRIRFDTQNNIHVVHVDHVEDLIVLSKEPSLGGAKNLQVIYIGDKFGTASNQEFMLKEANQVVLPVFDIETTHLLVRGTIKRFLNLAE